MSNEVYIIILIIGVATFFTLRWALKKFVKSDTLRIGLTWGGTIILTPLIYVGIIAIFFRILFYEPTRDFDKGMWFTDRASRYEMRDNIIESGILNDKNRQEIIDLIGHPDFGTDSTNVWNYDLGTSGAGLGFQLNTLIVTFNNDRVIKVEKREIVD
jgi:hypothetical protein